MCVLPSLQETSDALCFLQNFLHLCLLSRSSPESEHPRVYFLWCKLKRMKGLCLAVTWCPCLFPSEPPWSPIRNFRLQGRSRGSRCGVWRTWTSDQFPELCMAASTAETRTCCSSPRLRRHTTSTCGSVRPVFGCPFYCFFLSFDKYHLVVSSLVLWFAKIYLVSNLVTHNMYSSKMSLCLEPTRWCYITQASMTTDASSHEDTHL